VRTLEAWYPSDAIVLAGLEVLAVMSAVVALAWAVDRLAARRRAALRAGLWLAALIGVLLTPAAVAVGQRLPWRVAVLAAEPDVISPGPSLPRPQPSPADRGVQAVPSAAPPSREVAPPAERPAPPRRRAALSPGPTVPTRPPAEPGATATEPPLPPANLPRGLAVLAMLVWAAGSGYLALRLLHGARRVRRLHSRMSPLDSSEWGAELECVARTLSLARLPGIFVSPDVRSPLVAGLLPPRVVLPAALVERGERGRVLAALVHECAHVARRDPWVNLLQRVAAVLFWPHPLIHLLNRRLDHAREQVCDNHVLAYTDAPTYAEALLEIARACYPTPRLEGYLTMIPRHYALEHRVADLLAERRDTATRLPLRQRALLLAALTLCLVTAASVGFSGAAAAPAEQAAKEDNPPEKAAGEKLTGQVFLADGSPAGGAIVWAATFLHGPLERREAVADAKGNFSLPLSPGRWWVWARRGTQGGEGQTPNSTIRVTAGRALAPVTIRLEERGTFRGRILEAESGKPIPGARLYIDSAVVLTTDAAGKFEVGGLSRTHHESFVVASGRMRKRVLFDTTAEADTELDIPVPRAGKIVGRVTDTDGKPIPKANVGRSTSGSFFSINALYVACDSEGRFEYDDAVTPDQPTRLTASAPGYVPDEQSGVHSPEVGKPLVLNFRLRPSPGTPAAARAPDAEKLRAVSGVVLGPDGKPVAGVVVRWGYQATSDAKQTRTDAAGRFRLKVPDKENLLAVLPREFQPEFPEVAAGGDKDVNVKLREGQTAFGRVIDDQGKPIQGVQVIAVTPSPDPRIGNPYWLTEAAVYTGADGKFALKGVPGRAQFDFLKRGLSDVRNRELDLTRTDNSVVMVYGGALSGRVVDRDGKPIRSFRVLVNAPRERKPNDQSGGYFAGYCGIGVSFTSADGSFVLTGIGAGGVYRVTALAPGHGEATVDRMVSMPLNHAKNAKPVTLKAGPPMKLRVRAVTADGKPIAGARVTLVNGDLGLDQTFSWGYHDASWEDMVRGRTGADGVAEFPSLSMLGATVLVRAPGYARHRVGWRDAAKELKCEMVKEAVLTGEVRDAAGKPLKDFYVNLSGGGDQISASVGADEKGRFRIAELPAETWGVTIRGGEYGRLTLHTDSVTLKAGETKDLKFRPKKE
jgi:beta-lactamase regulating signal transducer with metallopeptidase domain/protocatechuate 3,4-dioxygenase beta subunit